MNLRLLLDEHISPAVAAQIRRHRETGGSIEDAAESLFVESVHTWRGGAFRGRRDKELLRAARAEGLTLVTFDQNTIPPLFFEFVQEGEDHAGVIFVDSRTIRYRRMFPQADIKSGASRYTCPTCRRASHHRARSML